MQASEEIKRRVRVANEELARIKKHRESQDISKKSSSSKVAKRATY